ncbi:hypothetical protein GCM10011348_38540 [Marinobacterium nitratireducens]|uniref:Peptidoglycan binding-like domain-containing protein n=1 Tax=Marinobacterium nitratireducens TaxID=518897 RepID=A0A918DXE3_9GAMM|nr:SEL1-like repeat protein [Marinobacterium nitratireducens]GGO86803.1 hypothetical protein GCM10011348_38540 [Marinobacterium nitratireducens]
MRSLRIVALGAALGMSGCSSLSLPFFTPEPDPQRAEAEYRTGINFTQGIGVEQDYAQGVRHFKRAARFGSQDAAYMTGLAYVTGRGVSGDFATAADWLEPAAEAGHPNAAFLLGKLYLSGLGVEKDKDWGVYWLGRAAEGGVTQAMLELAVCYHAGIGLPADPGMAWLWADRAADTGTDKAAKASSQLLGKSSASQRRQAINRVQSAASADSSLATVTYLQQKLAQLGYEPGLVDGLWGPRTREALEAFRLAESLPGGSVPHLRDLERLRDRTTD